MAETVTYTSPSGTTLTFGDSSLPGVDFSGITGTGMSPVDNFSVDTAYQPGAKFVRSKKNPATIKISLVLFGTGANPRQSMWQTVSDLGAVLNPAITTPGTLTKVGADGVSRQLQSVQYLGGLEVTDKAINWAYIEAQLLFEAFDPTWYSPSQHNQTIGASSDPFGFAVPITLPLTINGQAKGSATITNAGNIISQPIFTFAGPLENFSVFNSTTNQGFSISQTLAAGDTLVVDTLQGSITYTPAGGTASSLYSSFSGLRQWIGLAPGNNALTFARDVAGNQQCTISWFDTWNYA